MQENTPLSKFQERYDIAYPIFLQFYNLPLSRLREIVADILMSHSDYADVALKGDVIKKSRNDEPLEITFHYYDSIEISVNGIYLKPEHGPHSLAIEFNKYFAPPKE